MSRASPARVAANARYTEKAYDKYLVYVPKGRKSTVEQAAVDAGESVNAFTNRALLDRMGLTSWDDVKEGEGNA